MGTWTRVVTKGDSIILQGYDYVDPGDYHSQFSFKNEKCASYGSQTYKILNPNELALRCIALDILYAFFLAEKRKKQPQAQTLLQEEKVTRLLRIAEHEQIDFAMNGLEGIYHKENTYNYLIHKSRDYSIGTYLDRAETRSIEQRINKQTSLEQLMNQYIIQNINNVGYNDIPHGRTIQEMDHELFVQRFRNNSTESLVMRIQKLMYIASQEDLIRLYFANFRRSIQHLKEEDSLASCITRILEEFLKRHGNPGLAKATSDEVIKHMFLAAWEKQRL